MIVTLHNLRKFSKGREWFVQRNLKGKVSKWRREKPRSCQLVQRANRSQGNLSVPSRIFPLTSTHPNRCSIKSSEKHALNPQELTKAQLNLLHGVHIKKKKWAHLLLSHLYLLKRNSNWLNLPSAILCKRRWLWNSRGYKSQNSLTSSAATKMWVLGRLVLLPLVAALVLAEDKSIELNGMEI